MVRQFWMFVALLGAALPFMAAAQPALADGGVYVTGTITVKVKRGQGPDTKVYGSGPEDSDTTVTERHDDVTAIYTIEGVPDGENNQDISYRVESQGWERRNNTKVTPVGTTRCKNHIMVFNWRYDRKISGTVKARTTAIPSFGLPSRKSGTRPIPPATNETYPADVLRLHLGYLALDPKGNEKWTKTYPHIMCGRPAPQPTEITDKESEAPIELDSFEVWDFVRKRKDDTAKLEGTYDLADALSQNNVQRAEDPGWKGTVTFALTVHRLPTPRIVVGNPQPLRGEQVVLDATTSTGGLLGGQWTITPDDFTCREPNQKAGAPGSAQAAPETVPSRAPNPGLPEHDYSKNIYYTAETRATDLKLTLTPLCNFKARLEYTDNLVKGVTEVAVQIRPRPWRSALTYKDVEGLKPLSIVPSDAFTKREAGQDPLAMTLALNIPAFCVSPDGKTAYTSPDSCHSFYRESRLKAEPDTTPHAYIMEKMRIGLTSTGDPQFDEATKMAQYLSGEAMERVQVSPNRGPFQGAFYFLEPPAILFAETGIINPYLFSAEFERKNASLIALDPGFVGKYRNCRRFHERLHTELARDRLAKIPAGRLAGDKDPTTGKALPYDPAVLIEGMYDHNLLVLLERAMAVINSARLRFGRTDSDHRQMGENARRIFPPTHPLLPLLEECRPYLQHL